MKHVSCLVTLLVCLLAAGAVGAQAPPAAAEQTAVNRYRLSYQPVYANDFEGAVTDVLLTPPAVAITTTPSEVVSGSSSLKVAGPSAFALLRPGAIRLQRGHAYLLELDYRVIRSGLVGVVAQTAGASGAEFTLVGVLPSHSTAGTASWTFTAPGEDATFVFFTFDAAAAVVDNIRILSETREVTRAALPLLTAAFPRLADYMLLDPATIAGLHDGDGTEAERITARYDMLLGTGFDHTMGAAAWVRRLRALNPSLMVLPYRQAYMAQFDGSAGLNAQFNAGLHEDWFMRSPSGGLLAEPEFPMNVQLNHTAYAPAIEGQRLADYSASFLGRSVLTSGLWDGVLFDQAEWYRNPLLPSDDIDLDLDGIVEPRATIYRAWAAGFADYFRRLTRQFGFTQLLLGNAGYLANNPTAIGALNGWVAERVEPYASTAGGDWSTDAGSSWYRLLSSYLEAGRHARAPQVPVLEFTGRGLGQLTGASTPNGEPARGPALEPRDYRRMRLGLTTALLGNGFFEYDLVDNTSPSLWFDEYAVGAGGYATTSMSGKGYLGEPLADAQELPYASRTVFTLDFEGGTAPAGVYTGAGRITTATSEVVAGTRSLVVEKAAADTFSWFVWGSGVVHPGKTYQLAADYKVLAASPETLAGLLVLGFVGADGGMPVEQMAGLFMPDGGEAGRKGTVRAAMKVTKEGVSIAGLLGDVGTVAIDNVRLIEGTGGVWRRDFENGIVLVNPTPEPILVSQVQVAGARNRTGVRRISGTQAPEWNTGSPVTQGITLPPGDGIVLLADPVARPALARPARPSVSVAGTTATVTWAPSSGYPAGYQVVYGEHPSHLTRIAAAGRGAMVAIPDLLPGASYYVRVSAYDFRGRIAAASDAASFTVPGTLGTRPAFVLEAPGTLAPGATATVTGSALSSGAASGTRVEVNGIAAAVVSISSSSITFVTPPEIAGGDAILNIIRNGVPGIEQIVPLAPR